ncbi:hypothetical protein PBRA_008170, partial [Plasmodiophora brassicae]
PVPASVGEAGRTVAAASGAIHRKSTDAYGRRVKQAIGLALVGLGSYWVYDNVGTPEKTARFMMAQVQHAGSDESRASLLSALQMATATSDALKEGIIVSDGLSTLAPMLSSEDVELKRLSAAIVMDVSQYSSLAAEVASTPGLLPAVINNISDPHKEVAMNSLLALTILCGASVGNKLAAFDAGAIPRLTAAVRHPDLDIAHVACTTIGSIVKAFPDPDRLARSLDKKQRQSIVAAISQLGQSYVQQGNRSAAIDAFETSLTLDGTNPNIHNALGQLYQMDGNLAAANNAFREAIKYAPGLLEAQYNLAVNLTTHGSRADMLEAVKRMSDAIPMIDPSHPNKFDLMFLLGRTLDRLDRVSEACRVYRDIIRASPGLWRAHLALGRLLLKLDDTSGALKALRKAALLQPHDSQAQYQLALCLYRTGQLKEAADACDRALSLAVDDSGMQNAHLLRGKLYAQDGDWARALHEFTQLARLRADHADSHYQVARALQHLGNVGVSLCAPPIADRSSSSFSLGRHAEADDKLCDVLDCWTRQLAALSPAARARYFTTHAADARVLDLIGERRAAPGASPNLARKYDAFRATQQS